MGGMAQPAVARAARLGDGFLSTGGIGHDLYAQALIDLGKPRSAGAICAGNWSIVAPDPQRKPRASASMCSIRPTNTSVGCIRPAGPDATLPDPASAIEGGSTSCATPMAP